MRLSGWPVLFSLVELDNWSLGVRQEFCFCFCLCLLAFGLIIACALPLFSLGLLLVSFVAAVAGVVLAFVIVAVVVVGCWMVVVACVVFLICLLFCVLFVVARARR